MSLQFVTVATFNSVNETIIPKARLESEGIICFVRDEYSMYLQPFFSMSTPGIKLEVGSDDEADAIDILKQAGYL
ncbi:MAG TPA: hypothetical protein VL651_04740 [Bacteroidia bacterium]|jgi:hypothetical protein|nr:hypothetical protein [Bacteroidia bacterium]